MNVFIVHAHPEPKSFSAAMCRTAAEQLGQLGHEVRISDLYASGFNPVASGGDFESRQNPDYLNYALEQRHGSQTGTLSADVQEQLISLLWCDLLILNFPVFWCAPPAIMKGWFDRVLVSGLVYGGKRFYDRGGLVGKRALVSATIGAQAHMFQHGGIHGGIEDMLKPVLQGTLAYAGMSVLPPFMAWHVPYIALEDRQQLLQDYRQHLRSLDEFEPLEYPQLTDFDAALRPLANSSQRPVRPASESNCDSRP